jgi:hypothetical protein
VVPLPGGGERVFDAYGQLVPNLTADRFNDADHRALHDDAEDLARMADAFVRRGP